MISLCKSLSDQVKIYGPWCYKVNVSIFSKIALDVYEIMISQKILPFKNRLSVLIKPQNIMIINQSVTDQHWNLLIELIRLALL